MPKKPKQPPTDLVDRVIADADAGYGAPQEILPEAARADIVVHTPVMTPVARMVVTPWNTNVQSAEVFEGLLTDIREHGFVGAVEVVPFEGPDGQESYLVVSGEWRYKAAVALGLQEIPASRLTHKKFQDREFQQILSVRRNNLHGKHDKTKLRELVSQIATAHPDSEELRKLLAFTRADEWKKLVGQTRDGLKGQGATPEMLKTYDEKAKNARSLADLSVIVSRLFETYKDTVPFGFLIFTYGGQEHVQIAGTRGTMKSVSRIAAFCAERKVEVNTLLGPALRALADKLDTIPEGPASVPGEPHKLAPALSSGDQHEPF